MKMDARSIQISGSNSKIDHRLFDFNNRSARSSDWSIDQKTLEINRFHDRSIDRLAGATLNHIFHYPILIYVHHIQWKKQVKSSKKQNRFQILHLIFKLFQTALITLKTVKIPLRPPMHNIGMVPVWSWKSWFQCWKISRLIWTNIIR